MAENKTPEAPEENNAATEQANAPKQPKAPEQSATNPAQTTENVRDQVRRELKATAQSYEETPWHKMRHATEGPAKTAAHVGLALANPLVYGAVRGGDYVANWLAERMPAGIGKLYTAPRNIMINTADRAMNTLVAGATLPVAAPFTLAHEISDKMSGLDASKPKNLIGNVFDKLGDGIGLGLNIAKGAVNKTVEVGGKVVPEVVKGAASIATSPLKLIGGMYKGLGNVGGFTGGIGQLVLTGALAVGAHSAISATLPGLWPAGYYGYTYGLDVAKVALCRVLPIGC